MRNFKSLYSFPRFSIVVSVFSMVYCNYTEPLVPFSHTNANTNNRTVLSHTTNELQNSLTEDATQSEDTPEVEQEEQEEQGADQNNNIDNSQWVTDLSNNDVKGVEKLLDDNPYR